MRGQGGIARGLVVIALVIVLVGLGVNALVSRTTERARSSIAVDARSTVEPEGARTTVPRPDDEPTAEPAPPPTRPTEPRTPTPSPVVPEATPPDPADDPRLTPMAPGTSPLPPPRTPPGYDETAPTPHRGSLPPMVIRDVVHEALPELRFCFEWQLEHHPELAGRVTMELTIAEDGSVIDPRVLEDELDDETVTRCFTHVITGLHFPPPDGGGSVLVRYPFTMSGAPEPRRPEGI